MVISGWGGVVRHFAYFHKALPEDVVFSSLSDNLGWDPVSEEFGKLEGRERWPIPWLEDDPAMWLPQFHVDRFVRDMDLAEQYGCQGLMGIHWRHRIMDVDAGFQSANSWDKGLTPGQFFQRFASAQARAPRACSAGQNPGGHGPRPADSLLMDGENQKTVTAKSMNTPAIMTKGSSFGTITCPRKAS